VTLRRWLPTIIWGLVILASSSISLPSIAAPANSDKGVHVFLYGVLGYLAGRALLRGRNPQVWQLLVLVLGVLAYGALDEVHQRWIPTRTADPADWVADAAGSVSGIVASAIVTRARGRRAA
jgi:VanZ family protein